MEKSQSLKNISLALLKFHGAVGKIVKDASNPFFSNATKQAKYATLSNIQDAIRQPLQDAGLTYVQFPDGDNGLTTILMHADSGEFIQATYVMHPAPSYDKEKNKAGEVVWRSDAYVSPQGLGSAITYARRYALGAILGLNIDDDDDGNAASKTAQTNSKPTQQTKVNSLVDEATLQTWRDEVAKVPTLDELGKFYNSNKELCELHPQIKLVFTQRRKELEKK